MTTRKRQLHLWLEPEADDWVRLKAFERRASRSKVVESIIEGARADETPAAAPVLTDRQLAPDPGWTAPRTQGD